MPYIIGLIVVLSVVYIVFIVSCIKKVPSDKVMVVYGKVGTDKDGKPVCSKVYHGGAVLVWPIIQAYQFLDLTPIAINVDLKKALSRQKKRIDVSSRFTVGISTQEGVMQNAAERLLGLKPNEIQELANDIIFGQLRLVIAETDIEEIDADRDKFLSAVCNNSEAELKKIGLRLINVNLIDVDAST